MDVSFKELLLNVDNVLKSHVIYKKPSLKTVHTETNETIVDVDIQCCQTEGLTDNWEPVNFRIFSCVLSHISTLAHRNSSKLSQYVTLVPNLLSGKFQKNRIIHF